MKGFPRLHERVVFALVKDDTPQCEGCQRNNQAIEHARRLSLFCRVAVGIEIRFAGRAFLIGLCLGSLGFPSLEVRLVAFLGSRFSASIDPIVQFFLKTVPVRFHLRNGFKSFSGNPVLGHGAPPGSVDQADRYFHLPVNAAGKVVADGSTVFHLLGGAQSPVSDRVLWVGAIAILGILVILVPAEFSDSGGDGGAGGCGGIVVAQHWILSW